MQPDDPRHGTYAGAKQHHKDRDGICDPCRVEEARVRKRNWVRLQRGIRRIVPLGHDAYAVLVAHNSAEVARLTGIGRRQIRIYTKGGPTKMVYATTRDKIIAATGTATVVGLQRRIHALTFMGYSCAALERETNVGRDALKRIRAGNPQYVHVGTRTGILDAYRRLSLKPAGPSSSATRARSMAIANGWVGPFAWDEDTIDKPRAKPNLGPRNVRSDFLDPVVIERRLNGQKTRMLTPRETRELVRISRARGMNTGDLARVGIKAERYREAS